MNSRSNVMIGIVVIVLATLACSLLSPSAPPTPTAAPPTATPPSVPVTGNDAPLFTDNFLEHNGGWEVDRNPDATIEYANGGLSINVMSPGWFIWSSLGDKSFSDIHMEVTARKESSFVASSYSLGLMCDRQGKDYSYYWFVITASSGRYLIGKSTANQDDVNLSGDGDWKDSDLITQNALSYRIGVDCGHGALTLYVDGKKIDSVTDPTYTQGGVALVVWSGESSAGPVVFDDFSITPLK